jgi:hypothetical protein
MAKLLTINDNFFERFFSSTQERSPPNLALEEIL